MWQSWSILRPPVPASVLSLISLQDNGKGGIVLRGRLPITVAVRRRAAFTSLLAFRTTALRAPRRTTLPRGCLIPFGTGGQSGAVPLRFTHARHDRAHHLVRVRRSLLVVSLDREEQLVLGTQQRQVRIVVALDDAVERADVLVLAEYMPPTSRARQLRGARCGGAGDESRLEGLRRALHRAGRAATAHTTTYLVLYSPHLRR
eukprot:scaffold160860_cov28-Tisochrysis_lutea.AAC.1